MRNNPSQAAPLTANLAYFTLCLSFYVCKKNIPPVLDRPSYSSQYVNIKKASLYIVSIGIQNCM